MVMMITSRVATVLHKDFIICSFLGSATGHITFTLLSDNIGDSRFLALEVIADCFCIVCSFTFFKDRFTFDRSRRVFNTVGVYCTAVQIHGNHFRCQLNVLVVDFAATIKRSGTSQCKSGGVVRFINNRCIERLFLCRCYRVDAYHNCIRSQRIVPVKGIRLCSVGGNHPSSSTLRRSLIRKHQQDNQQYE